jgi:hypothetical protein
LKVILYFSIAEKARVNSILRNSNFKKGRLGEHRPTVRSFVERLVYSMGDPNQGLVCVLLS